MFYGYPIEATDGNWLHTCLDNIVRQIHVNVAAGKNCPQWPNCIPAAHKTALSARHGLKQRFKAYFNALVVLTAPDRDRVLAALESQNKVAELLSGASDCERISELPPGIRATIVDLYDFAFELLSDLGLRDAHYKSIFEKRPLRVCPFCNMEYFDPPSAPREDADHYLCKSIYPFAGANLRNLAPMGMKCNQRYKKAVDMLFTAEGVRRRAFDPYHDNVVRVSLLDSVPFGTASGSRVLWKVDLVPAAEECETWDQVFKIRKRCADGVLEHKFNAWLSPLANWWKITNRPNPATDAEVHDGLKDYIDALVASEPTGQDFLKVPMFEMLHAHCAAGNSRLTQLLATIIRG